MYALFSIPQSMSNLSFIKQEMCFKKPVSEQGGPDTGLPSRVPGEPFQIPVAVLRLLPFAVSPQKPQVLAS